MARPESVAVAGYYPTPPHILPRIAALIAPKTEGDRGHAAFCDPCAGEGVAISTLAESLGFTSADFFTCEMEANRHETLRRKVGSHYLNATRAVHGDAFRISFDRKDKAGVSMLFLNPPYDIDRVHGRLEQRFLDRFLPALKVDGILAFLVPFYALKASASYLAKECSDLHCFRFPQGDFETFKQVVLLAKKGEGLFDPDPKVLELVNAWAADPSGLPELPAPGSQPLFDLPLQEYMEGLAEWRLRPIDLTSLLAKSKPWQQTMRGGGLMPVPGIIPDTPVQDLLLRQYPLATPPRPAHIAAGIASGLFNGAKLDPSIKGLPPLLVKGVFDKEYRTVEEKHNKEGMVRAVVQIQQPKLVTTVLDLHSHQYHVLKTGTGTSATLNVAQMTVADLIQYYGDSMMAVMAKQCPILYDPRRDSTSISLAASPRKLFTAQSHASKAIVKLLGGPSATKRQRQGKAAVLLGEIGSGKSTVAAIVGETIGARRPLIMCPPHLLDGWTDQIAAVLPDADVRILRSIEDLEKLQQYPQDKTVVSILSREGAKLTHSWAGVGAICPKCGHDTPAIDLAKKRARCDNQDLGASDALARFVHGMAVKLSSYAPQDPSIRNILRSRFDQTRLNRWAKRAENGAVPFPGFEAGYLDVGINQLVQDLLEDRGDRQRLERALLLALFCAGDEARILDAAGKLAMRESHHWSSIEKDLLLLLPPNGTSQKAFVEEFGPKQKSYYRTFDSVATLATSLSKGTEKVGGFNLTWASGELLLDGQRSKDLHVACRAFAAIGSLASFTWGPECGEFLYGAVPEPRRVALAKHIVKYHSGTFDLLVLDEGHEYATDGSAQERSAHRLTALGIPTILMTGTIMNGYAESLFTNMWALSQDFRRDFDRDDAQKFVDRFGYRKRLLEDKDRETGEVVEFGYQSDRVQRSERVIGNAPGVLPLFLLRHLLPISVTLHKADLAIDLPACKQVKHEVEPSQEQRKRYTRLQNTLIQSIRHDQFVPEVAGKLWGQLAELPSYLDRATSDTGNTDDGSYEIRYPENCGGALVASEVPIDASEILPKEAWMLDLIDKEMMEDRNVMVFCWHTNLLPRIARLIEERIGERVPILYADKVSTGKRQAWIEKEVVKKDRHVLVCNPVAIQTGLNNLVHFASEVWLESPACNPVTFRQAVGRVDRIGQKLETRIHSAIYKDTLQEQLYDLLMQKVAVAVSTDGLDPEAALQAAGVGEDEYFAGLSIGKQLWRMFAATEEAA
jgi:hypothetical protein